MHERFYNIRVKIKPCFVLQFDNCFAVCFLPLLGAGINKFIIVVCYRNNSGSQRNVYAFKAFGISGAVPFFMVGMNDGDNMAETLDIFKHACASLAMPFVDRHFAGAQVRGFHKDHVGHGKTAISCSNAAVLIQETSAGGNPSLAAMLAA